MTKRLIAACAALIISGTVLAYAGDREGFNGMGWGSSIPGVVGDAYAPSRSADGTKIAYYDDNYQIWTMNIDGTAHTKVTSGHFDLNPSWSPDGRKIAFRRGTIIGGSSYSDIWIMDADGTNQTPLTDARGSNGYYDRPSWSPDGTKIAMEAAVKGMMSEIYIIDVRTKKLVNATAGNTRDNNRISHQAPSWLADGKRIAFFRNEDPAVITIDSPDMNR